MAHERDLSTELRHRHQQRRATTTILVVLLLLFFAFWYAFSYYRASTERSAAAPKTATCRPYDPKVAAPANTTVNVYNATSKEGLAGRTATELRRRGFTVGKVANDPLGRSVKAAEVRFGPGGKSRAELVAPLGGKGTTKVADKRKDTTVDLVLGAGFTTLAPSPKPSGLPMCAPPSATPKTSTTASAGG